MRAWLRRNVLLLLAVIAASYLASGIYYVPTDRQAVKLRLGRLLPERVQPGLQYAAPYPLEQVILLKTNEARRLTIGGTDLDRALGVRTPTEDDSLLSGDQNLVHVRASIQYYVRDPGPYLFRSRDLPGVLEVLLYRSLSRAVAVRGVDDVLTTGRIEIQNRVREDLQREADQLALGVAVTALALEQVRPPQQVRDAFLEVADAREDRNRIVQEARGYSSELLPRTRGRAQEDLQQARTYSREVVDRAQGESQHFLSLWGEYRRHPTVTTARLFLEAMEEILPRTRKVILDDAGSQQGLDLDIFALEE